MEDDRNSGGDENQQTEFGRTEFMLKQNVSAFFQNVAGPA